MALLQAGSAADQVGALNSTILDYVKLLFILAGILVLAWVGLRYWLPRFSGTASSGTGPIQVVARQPLEPRKTLYIVKAGGEYLLIGSADQDVNLLTRLEASAVEAELAAPPAQHGFKSVLERFQAKTKGDAE